MNIPVAMCAVVVCAAGLRTCSSHERGLRDFINEKFSRCEDGDISVVGFAGDRLPDWLVDVEQNEYANVSNMWIAVAIDRSREQWKINIGSSKFYFFARAGKSKGCMYHAKSDTMVFTDKIDDVRENDFGTSLGRLQVPSIISPDEIFDKFQGCAAVYLGNGKTGIMCWRSSLSERQAKDLFGLLSWRSEVLKKFPSWQTFLQETSCVDGNRDLQLGDLKELIDGDRNLVFIGGSPVSLFVTRHGCFSYCDGEKGKYGEYMPFLRRCAMENSGMSILLRVDENASVGTLANAMSDCKAAGISRAIICAITNSACEEFDDNKVDLPMMQNCYKIDVAALQLESLDIEIRRGRNMVIDGEFVSLSKVATCVAKRVKENDDFRVFKSPVATLHK